MSSLFGWLGTLFRTIKNLFVKTPTPVVKVNTERVMPKIILGNDEPYPPLFGPLKPDPDGWGTTQWDDTQKDI